VLDLRQRLGDHILQAYWRDCLQYHLPRWAVHFYLDSLYLPAMQLHLRDLLEYSIELYLFELQHQLLLPRQLLPLEMPRQLLHRHFPQTVPPVHRWLPELLWTRARCLHQMQDTRKLYLLLPSIPHSHHLRTSLSVQRVQGQLNSPMQALSLRLPHLPRRQHLLILHLSQRTRLLPQWNHLHGQVPCRPVRISQQLHLHPLLGWLCYLLRQQLGRLLLMQGQWYR
jgi:hypothetical protein